MKARLLSLLPIILCVAILMSGCVEQPPVPYDVYEGEIITQQPVHIDTETHTLRFGKDAVLTYGKNQIPIGGKSYDISGAKDGDRLYYHPDTQRVYPFDAHQAICLGVYRKPAILTELNMDSSLLYVNGRNAAILTELRTKKVVCLGDSMTIGHTDSPGYALLLPQVLGASDVTSYGVINSCVTPRPEDEMPENSEDTSFYGLYDKMDDDADIVIVLGGINDWGFGRELGKFGDTGTETFCGAMNLLCSGLKEKYPNAEIFVFSSPQTDYVNNPANDLEGTEWEGNTEGYNCHGKKLGEYAKAMQTACVKQGIHFYSLTQAMPLSDSANSNVHPGVAKSVRIAELITNFIFDTYTK